MKKRTHKELHAASADMLEEMHTELQSIHIKSIRGTYWLLLARELMDLLPRNTVDQTFLEVHGRIQEALKLAPQNEDAQAFGPYGQEALTDWVVEVREHIEAVKGEI